MSSLELNNRYTFEELINQLHQSATTFGYHRIDLPIIDNADVFLMRSGDQVISNLFTFERHGTQLALRPEFTAAAAHRYASLYTDSAPVVRWQFDGTIFKEDDVGSDYQHYSVGAELIGLRGAFADSEIIGVALAALRSLNIQAYRVIVGHTGLLRDILSAFRLDGRTQRFILNRLSLLKQSGVDVILDELSNLIGDTDGGKSVKTVETDPSGEDTQQMLDTLLDAAGRGDTMGGRSRYDIAQRLLRKRQRAAERAEVESALRVLHRWINVSGDPISAFGEFEEILPGGSTTARQQLDEWRRLIELLVNGYQLPADKIVFQPDLSRDWNYYTGMVFEIRQNDTLLCGGGRYDELIRLMGGHGNVPAVGLAYFPQGLLQHLQAGDTHSATAIMTLRMDADAEAESARWAMALREAGQVVEVLPDDSTQDAIAIRANGTAQIGENTYTIDQVRTLIEEWKSQ